MNLSRLFPLQPLTDGIDIKSFIKINVTDTCAIWNILSSKILLAASFDASCYFSITKFVEYECLIKGRKSIIPCEVELMNKLKSLLSKYKINKYNLAIADLQEIELIQKRRKLGMGELSSIAFAKRTNQVFLTDDQNARKLASDILGRDKVQTTPHLLGWLFMNQNLSDADLVPILAEHLQFNRPLEKYYREVYEESLRIKLLLRVS